MSAWWESLSDVLRVLYCIAIPSTLLLIIQAIMVAFSFGEGGAGVNPSDTSGLDLDGSGDLSMDADGMDMPDVGDVSEAGEAASDFGTLRLFTMQGIVAFITTFSWVAICFVKAGMQTMPSLLIGMLCGIGMMYLVAKLLQMSAKLAENGTFNAKSTIGETAQVYVSIPAGGERGGKVTLTMARGFVELDAITDEAELIAAGQLVRITDVIGDTVVVEPAMQKEVE